MTFVLKLNTKNIRSNLSLTAVRKSYIGKRVGCYNEIHRKRFDGTVVNILENTVYIRLDDGQLIFIDPRGDHANIELLEERKI